MGKIEIEFLLILLSNDRGLKVLADLVKNYLTKTLASSKAYL